MALNIRIQWSLSNRATNDVSFVAQKLPIDDQHEQKERNGYPNNVLEIVVPDIIDIWYYFLS